MAQDMGFSKYFSKGILSILINEKKVMARCLLDTGCTKSMILKTFIDQKQGTKLSEKDSIKYETYGSSLKSLMIASVGFKMLEFKNQKNDVGIQKTALLATLWISYGYPAYNKRVDFLFEFSFTITLTMI